MGRSTTPDLFGAIVTDRPIDERTFFDEEVREILKRAVRAPSHSVTRAEGLSLRELKAIGEEVGIEPARVEQAARAVAARTAGLLGAPLRHAVERQVSGTLDPDDTGDALAVLRGVLGRRGEVQEIHGALEWSANLDSGERHVTISAKEGVTTLRGSANLTNAAVGTFLPAGLFGAIVTVASLGRYAKSGSEVALVVALLVLPVLFPILRGIFAGLSLTAQRQLEEALDGVARLVGPSDEAE